MEEANGSEALVVPEDVGRVAAHALLEEVQRGGVVDGCHQSLLLTLCAVGQEELQEVGGASWGGAGLGFGCDGCVVNGQSGREFTESAGLLICRSLACAEWSFVG